jgi:exopolysaccharide production protein ExoZ
MQKNTSPAEIQTKQSDRLYSVQALRAMAAGLVVIFHARAFAYPYQEKYGLAPAFLCDFKILHLLGGFGVDLFFVISGFVMTYIMWNEPRSAKSIWPFLKRRLMRIIPIYWFYTFFLVALGLSLPKLFTETIDLATVLRSLFLIPYTPVGANPAPILAVGWTLSFEMYFYALVAIGMFIPRRTFIIALGVYFTVWALTPLFVKSSSAIFGVASNLLVFEFYFGMLICAAFMSRGSFNKILGWCALTLGIVMLALETYFLEPPFSSRGLVWGLPASCIVIWFISRERNGSFMRFSLWQALGASSYTLYLTHFIILAALGRIGYALGLMPHIPTDLYIVLTSIFCLIAGHILYLAVERPLGRVVASLFKRRSKKADGHPVLAAD